MQKDKTNIDVFENVELMNLKGIALIALKQISREENDPFFMRKDIVSFVPCYREKFKVALEELE